MPMRCWILAMMIGLAWPAGAKTDDPLADDAIHADLPLFGTDTKNIWPQHFSSDNGDFGCTSRIKFGAWKLHRTDRDDDDAEWYAVRNYGVFHCFALVASADERAALRHATGRPSFFILLETSGNSELWALQIGARPGSDYLLLRRTADGGIIGAFDVLQRDCPAGFRRKGPPLDIATTSYCAINTPQDLKLLARQMAKRPALGHLVWAEGLKDED
jgi:hypothetical protein